MSAEVAQTTADALPANHVRSTFEVTDIDKPWDQPHGQAIHIFGQGDETSLCGHVGADAHPTSLACDADHDHRLIYSTQICDHCSRSVRKRVREDGLTTGHDSLDAVIRTETGDELTVETPNDTYTFTVDETGFSICSVDATGSTGRDAPEGCEYWCDKITVSVKADGSVQVRHPYNVLEGPTKTTGTVVSESGTVFIADGGTAETAGDGREENECPRCGDEGIENPVLDDWYECNRCVIAFSADGEVEEGD